MKNYEKYGRELKKYRGGMFCDDYVKPDVLKLKKDDECDHDCIRCLVLQMLWLMEEYEEPEVDWSKVEVDTPILVKNSEDEEWRKRHFAKYKNGNVYAWSDGLTSWTAYDMMVWKCAKLAEDGEERKELEVDWSEVEVDTPILVREYEDGEWIKRYFAKYKDGKVYAWNGGRTGQTESYMTPWNYAKLSEDEEERKELEVDWSKVNVDTPILVGEGDGEWVKRYFAEYKDGIVYAWCGGSTSWDANNMMMSWKYAKLAKNEESK